MLIDIASKGGNFLMNVGPRPDGELSRTEYDALAGIGEWMAVNGESIYGTRKGQFLQLDWGKSTTKGKTIFLHVYDWPADGILPVPGLISAVNKAYLLADSTRAALDVSSKGENTFIDVGSKAPDTVASVVVLELEEEPKINNVYRQKGNASVELGTYFASIESEKARYNFGYATRKGNFIQDIESTGDRISWDFVVNTPGDYRVVIKQATQNEQAGSKFRIEVGGHSIQAAVEGTADWGGDILQVQRQEMDEGERHNNLWLFKDFDLGTVKIDTAGQHTLVIRPESIAGDYLMFLKSVTLTPVD